jgi:hypothetical protein
MRAVRFEVFRQTPERILLRFYGDNGRLAGTRELEQKDVELFVAEGENAYSTSAALADHARLPCAKPNWGGAVELTRRDRSVAVLLSHKEYSPVAVGGTHGRRLSSAWAFLAVDGSLLSSEFKKSRPLEPRPCGETVVPNWSRSHDSHVDE